jgi:hypothetical protein
MPFELGLFLGAKYSGQRGKRCLIFDREKFRYQKFLSDISGQDPKSHENDEAKLIEAVRDWLAEDIHPVRIPGGRQIYRRFVDFKEAYPALRRELQLDHTRFHFNDYCHLVSAWLEQVPPQKSAKPTEGEWKTVDMVENGRIVQRQILIRSEA